MWKKDNFFIGVLSALVLTALTALLIVFAAPLIQGLFSENPPENKLILLALFPPVLLMRYYMRKLRFEKAGMGALLLVFLLIVLYFVLIEGKPLSIFPL